MSVKIKGIDCYGEVRENSNFYIICEDERYDGIWADGNPDDVNYEFKNWTEVVKVLTRDYRKDIVEIQEV